MGAPASFHPSEEVGQADVIDFLRNPASHPGPVTDVDVVETHSAMVFLAGDLALKIKRAVKFDYLDFSSLERRHEMCLRELQINRRTAPQIYRRVVPITRENSGKLAIDGIGQPVEWAVLMSRFDQTDLLSSIADRGALDDALVADLATHIAQFHESAQPVKGIDEPARLGRIVSELTSVFAGAEDVVSPEWTAVFARRTQRALGDVSALLRDRTGKGRVRHCHGDLHLNNIVVLDGKPVLFDAIEFSTEIAEIDTLYDLAFAIMDLEERGLRPQSNQLLNRYLHCLGDEIDIQGLAAMPLFLACRAGIRAMVEVQRGRQMVGDDRTGHFATAARYAESAAGYLRPCEPRLIAVGGFSGSGKTTLARNLAPFFPQAPGAVHLRSDLERKSMLGVEETVRLGSESYTPEVNKRVYGRLASKTRLALRAGRTVIVDAVFAHASERDLIENLAAELGAAFQGLWLDAPIELLRNRVESRKGDASDATSAVVDRQVNRGAGEPSWQRIDTGGSPALALDAARTACAQQTELKSSAARTGGSLQSETQNR